MARKIEVQIVGDASSLKRAVGQSESTLGRLGGTFGTLAKTAAFTAGAAGLGAIAITLKQGIAEYTEAAKVGAQTNAVIKSTGGIANVTAKQVDELAESMMKKTGIDDEAIQSGENMLLTFTKIRNEVGKGNDIFDQATLASTNLSVALGKDLPSSALLVGKALNDPIKGMTALTRAGVQFTDSQKEMIKRLVESGDVIGAQKIILKELETQFGGSAEAIGKTLPGQLNILRESFNNFAGDLVARAMPQVERFVKFLNTVTAAPTIQAKLRIVWEGLESVASDLNERLRAEFAKIDWADLFISGFKAIDFSAVLAGVFNAIIAISTTQWQVISAIWLGAWRAILSGLAAIGTQIVGAVGSAMTSVVAAVRGAVAGALSAATELGQAILNGVRTALSTIGGVVSNAMNSVVAAVRNIIGAAASAATAVGQAIVNGIRSALSAIGGVVRTALSALAGAVRGFAGEALSAGVEVGRAIIEGIGAGIRGAIGGVISAAVGAVHSIVGAVKGAAQIRSPSELMKTEVGEPLAEGILVGLLSGLDGLEPTINTVLDQAVQGAGVHVRRGLAALNSEVRSFMENIDTDVAASIDLQNRSPRPVAPVSTNTGVGGGVTINNYAPISSQRDFEDMVRGALSNVTGRQGFG